MIRLMIVDDEQIVLDGLRFLIEDRFEDIQIVATLRSGREAVEACRTLVPDLVLMDIKMPGISGIEAIETIRKQHQEIRFIIISAYEQFEYAQQAVELGVREYILKPVNPAKLTEVLQKAVREIKEEQERRTQEMENREKLERILPVLEHGFIYSLLLGEDYREELGQYRELFEIQKESGFVLVFEFGEGVHGKLRNRIGTGVKSQSFYPLVQSILKYKCKCIVGPMIINRMTVLVYEDRCENEYEQRLSAMELGEALHQKIQEVADTNVYVGIGGCHPLEKIKNSLEEANYALNRMSDEQILHFGDIAFWEDREDGYSFVDIKADEVELIQMMETAPEEELVRQARHFFNRVEKKFKGSSVDVQNILLELMVMALGLSYRHNLQEADVGYSTYLGEFKRLESLVELENWCLQKIRKIAGMVQGSKHQHVSKVVLEAKEFIDAHYNQDLSLQEVSKRVSVSPQYFSKIFKEEIGLSYVEYVRKIRIDVAKDMLRSQQYSVKEICYRIGYNDPNYFSRLFKKLVGVSPTDYK
ncbi:response regulator transcription factor [Anaerotalea alkaliphila]|uniref:Stage 0 sporulation protein A homolog n=1 Tax=Anaerotalea alkaliphila TaxID=2662126 RepID=A0A7X5HV13_9FIRM|nr:response regulator [Anaerotalea alkaliphila]NDL67146.1 response regulator [Anaerotalea alkaliphila]